MILPEITEELIEWLLPVYLDGFLTGASSALLTVAPGIPEEARDAIAEYLTRGIDEDPALAETLREEIRERLNGLDTGPKNLRMAGPA